MNIERIHIHKSRIERNSLSDKKFCENKNMFVAANVCVVHSPINFHSNASAAFSFSPCFASFHEGPFASLFGYAMRTDYFLFRLSVVESKKYLSCECVFVYCVMWVRYVCVCVCVMNEMGELI